MELVKLGRSGQVSIPRAVLKRLGIEPETMMLVEVTADGGILLRPAGVYPIEIYSDERVTEFLEEDRPPKEKSARSKSPRRRAR
jgi:AbrB family looped-hinge helix DNA binding protein